ncbi:MAG: DUF3842 family protein [Desulfamplus sp.]|nr:DUF3842 family protein [Desulfamplus sp.]MBF0241637.1 DUF3842 family protein [Desulfamplus sp.]MBF0389083.1 DUF3842 family protein [Desulfamplus sp.]
MHKRVCVIDGQGGGIGVSLIKYLRDFYGESIEITAIGTNAIAASQMMKAGANRAASGENAIVQTVKKADVIIGPIAITWANAMMGEVTPNTAEAVMSASALKILLPLNQENVVIVGFHKEPLPHLIKYLIETELKEVFKDV